MTTPRYLELASYLLPFALCVGTAAAQDCTSFQIAPGTSQSVLLNGAATSATWSFLTTPANCSWTARPSSVSATFQISPTSGTGGATITASFTPNNSTLVEIDTVTVSSGNASLTLTATRNPSSCSLSASPSSLNLTAAGGSRAVQVSSNLDVCHWLLSANQFWLSVPGEELVGSHAVSVLASTNVSKAARSGSVTSVGMVSDISIGVVEAACTLFVLFQNPASGVVIVNGFPVSIEVSVADDCAVAVDKGNIGVSVSFSNGDPSVTLTAVGGGRFVGTWAPRNTQNSVTLQASAFLGLPSGDIIGSQVSVTVGTTTTSAPASVAAIVDAASSLRTTAPAPGSLISLYGTNLASITQVATSLPLATSVGGTTVFLGNAPLPLFFVSPTQINAMMPYGLPVNTQYQLIVQRSTSLSVPLALTVAAAAPGIFTLNQQGTGQGAIVKSDGVTIAQAGTPAAIGETIVIYCEGLGAVTPPLKEGAAVPTTPLSTTNNPVFVTIGGKPASVVFSGLTPGLTGLYQVNAIVPAGITAGDSVPVVLTVANQASPAVTMAVR